MVKVSYSTEILEYKIFLDVISRFVRLGWHGEDQLRKMIKAEMVLSIFRFIPILRMQISLMSFFKKL